MNENELENECVICRKKEFTATKISHYVCDKCFKKELLNEKGGD